MQLTTRPSSFAERLRKARRKAALQALTMAHDAPREVEVIAKSESSTLHLQPNLIVPRPWLLTHPSFHSRKESSKRQRTNSHSSSTLSLHKSHAPPASSSDEALANTRPSDHSPKKFRGAAARNHHAKEQREQRERERATAAERRAARSERRRGDGS